MKLLYFLMEFIEGMYVAQLIASEGRLDAARAAPIIAAVCEALAFAHEEGIVHRDIKPSNIMIDKKGRVKVADFGLAKAVNIESTLMTRSDVAMGTPDFVAPEALIPGMKVDGRADLYAVGVMLYQMLTGKIPRGRFELPSGVIPQVDKGFDAIVDRAMQTDRDKRYSTATEMKRDVESVVMVKEGSAGTPVRSHPTGGSAAKKEAPKSGRAPLLIAAAVVVLGGGAFFLTREDSPGRADGPPSAANGPSGANTSQTALGGPSALPAPLPQPGPDGRMVFPVGVWTQMKDLAKHEKTEDGPWVRLGEVGYGWYEKDVVLMTNLGIRARFRGQRVKDYDYPQLNLRGVKDKTPALNLHIRSGKMQIRVMETGFPVLAEATLREPLPAGKEYVAELYAIGQQVIARVNGQVLTATTKLPPAPGNFSLFGADWDYFQDAQVLNLDGLSEAEALKAAGIGE